VTASPVGWGLIGSSGLAARTCAPSITQAGGAELVAVLGSDAERARQLAAGHGAGVGTAGFDEFIAAPGLEAAWIASPTHLHYEQGSALLRAGKHVLLEKPLAMSAAEGWKLVEQARDAGLVLAVGYQARYVAGHIEMRRLISGGAIGDVSVARTYYAVHRPGPPPKWRQQLATARWGALADIGTHHIDLLRMMLGEITQASGFSARRLGFETDDADTAALRFESGALATVTASVNVWKAQTRVEVHGTAGAMIAEDTSPRGGGTVVMLRPGADPEDISGVERADPFVLQVEAITQATRGGTVEYASGEDGARNLDVLEQIAP
jgi:1,5-anhydro-D-fructose reductase (1,5-anhydro-D-mannitol-forming)